jgi:hypothetical protein
MTGDMFDFKGPTYARLIEESRGKDWGKTLDNGFVALGVKELGAIRGTGRRLIWCFAERAAAEHVYDLFKGRTDGCQNIIISVFPYLGDQ